MTIDFLGQLMAVGCCVFCVAIGIFGAMAIVRGIFE